MIERNHSLRVRQTLVLLSGIFAGAMIVLALAIALGGIGTSRAVSAEQAVTAPPFQPPPLADEWRWSPPAVDYQHMYRRR